MYVKQHKIKLELTRADAKQLVRILDRAQQLFMKELNSVPPIIRASKTTTEAQLVFLSLLRRAIVPTTHVPGYQDMKRSFPHVYEDGLHVLERETSYVPDVEEEDEETITDPVVQIKTVSGPSIEADTKIEIHPQALPHPLSTGFDALKKAMNDISKSIDSRAQAKKEAATEKAVYDGLRDFAWKDSLGGYPVACAGCGSPVAPGMHWKIAGDAGAYCGGCYARQYPPPAAPPTGEKQEACKYCGKTSYVHDGACVNCIEDQAAASYAISKNMWPHDTPTRKKEYGPPTTMNPLEQPTGTCARCGATSSHLTYTDKCNGVCTSCCMDIHDAETKNAAPKKDPVVAFEENTRAFFEDSTLAKLCIYCGQRCEDNASRNEFRTPLCGSCLRELRAAARAISSSTVMGDVLAKRDDVRSTELLLESEKVLAQGGNVVCIAHCGALITKHTVYWTINGAGPFCRACYTCLRLRLEKRDAMEFSSIESVKRINQPDVDKAPPSTPGAWHLFEPGSAATADERFYSRLLKADTDMSGDDTIPSVASNLKEALRRYKEAQHYSQIKCLSMGCLNKVELRRFFVHESNNVFYGPYCEECKQARK